MKQRDGPVPVSKAEEEDDEEQDKEDDRHAGYQPGHQLHAHGFLNEPK